MVGAEKTCFNASMWTCPVLGAVKWKAHEKMLKKCVKMRKRIMLLNTHKLALKQDMSP